MYIIIWLTSFWNNIPLNVRYQKIVFASLSAMWIVYFGPTKVTRHSFVDITLTRGHNTYLLVGNDTH